jgi:hypothetical protein
MNQPDDRASLGKFEPSEAAMDEYRASRRRYFWPGLGFLAMYFLLLGLQNLHVPAPVLLGLLCVGFTVWSVMVWKNYRIARRADLRLKAEKREWDARKAGPS